MPTDLTPTIEILRERVARLTERIRGRLDYDRISGHSSDVTDALQHELASHESALDLLTAEDALSCPGDCLTCDVPAAECELPASADVPEPPDAA